MAAIRFRRFIAGICLVLSAILVVFAGTGLWLERNFLDTNRFTKTATETIKNPDVQKAIASEATDQIVGENKKLQIAKPFIEPIVQQVVASDPFQKVFEEAVRNAHQVLTGPKSKEIVLNISEVVDSVKSVLQEVAPGLADQIPDGERVEVTVLKQSRLDVIWQTIDIVKNVVIGLVIGFFVFLILGFLIAPYRWRSLGLFGATTAIVSILLFAVLSIGRAIAAAQAPNQTLNIAINSAWDIILGNLMWMTVWLGLVGAALFLIGRFIDRSGGWSTSWSLIRQAWSGIGRTAAAVGAQAAQATRSAVARAEDAGRRGEPEPVADAPAPEAAVDAGLTAGPRDVAAAETSHVLTTGRRMWGGLRPVWRAVILVIIGVIALIQPGGLVNIVVGLIGLVLLWFAFLEGVTAWRSNKPEEPSTTEP